LIGIGGVWIEAKRSVEVRQGCLVPAQLMFRRTAIAVGIGIMRVYFNGLAKVFDGALGPNRVIFSGKPAKLTPESEILKSSKPLPARKP